MIVCVPVMLDGQIDPRWGRASRVAVADVSDGVVASWQVFDVGWDRLHDVGTEGGHHARVALFLRDHQVDTVLAHHMGEEIAHMLQRMGIAVRQGIGGDARQAVVATTAAANPAG